MLDGPLGSGAGFLSFVDVLGRYMRDFLGLACRPGYQPPTSLVYWLALGLSRPTEGYHWSMATGPRHWPIIPSTTMFCRSTIPVYSIPSFVRLCSGHCFLMTVYEEHSLIPVCAIILWYQYLLLVCGNHLDFCYTRNEVIQTVRSTRLCHQSIVLSCAISL